MSFKKNVKYMILFLLIAGLSIWAIMTQVKSFSLNELLRQLNNANYFYLALAFLAMVLFIVFEGLALDALVEGLANKNSKRKSMTYAAADIYFSAITPSASGGQPASIFFMMKDGISGAKCTVILIVNLMMYTFALLACGMIAFVLEPAQFGLFDPIAKMLIGIGVIVLIALTIIFYMLLKHEEIFHVFLNWLISLGGKLHVIRKPEAKKERLSLIIKQYKMTADLLEDKKQMLVKAFIYNFLQRLTLSLVSMFCYLATNTNFTNGIKVWCMQIYTTLGSNSVPIPGAMGVADYLLIEGLTSLNIMNNPANLGLLSRGISFYSCIVLSVIITVVGYVNRKRKSK